MVFLTNSNKALIGFIGLGNMGCHMANNLIKKGHELIVFDLNKKSVKIYLKYTNLQKTHVSLIQKYESISFAHSHQP